MKSMRKTMMTAIAALAMTAPMAKADGKADNIYYFYMDGERLNKDCQQLILVRHGQPADQLQAGMCVGYVLGAYDMMLRDTVFCIPTPSPARRWPTSWRSTSTGTKCGAKLPPSR
jgi:Ssp1 endopeptidase immunity protein Rap1a